MLLLVGVLVQSKSLHLFVERSQTGGFAVSFENNVAVLDSLTLLLRPPSLH